MVTVVALAATRTEFGSLIRKAIEGAPIGDSSLISVICPDVRMGNETAADLIVEGAPVAARTRILVMHPGRDRVAHRMLGEADVIIANSAADAAAPAVSAASASTRIPSPSTIRPIGVVVRSRVVLRAEAVAAFDRRSSIASTTPWISATPDWWIWAAA